MLQRQEAERDNENDDVIHVDSKNKRATVLENEDEYDVVYTDGGKGVKQEKGTLNKLRKEGYKFSYPYGAGMTVTDFGLTVAGGEMIFAKVMELLYISRIAKLAKPLTNLIPDGKLANHIFKGVGKLADTPANRSLITEISNGVSIGVDQYGKKWFARTLNDGTQIYTYAQNGVIKGAGINQTAIDIVARYGLK